MRLAFLFFLLLTPSAAYGQVPTQSHLRDNPAEVRQEDLRVQQVIVRSEEHFKLGELHLRDQRGEAARAEFNKALDSVLESGIDVRAHPRLKRYYLELVERVYRYEASAGALPTRRDRVDSVEVAPPVVGFTEQAFEPSPLDELSKLVSGPYDPKSAPGARCEADVLPGVELRGFRVGMSVEEVKARIPTLRLKPADRFNYSSSFTWVKSDRHLGALPLLSDVRAISLEYVDGRAMSVALIYDNAAKWEDGREFAAQVGRALGLRGGWAEFTGPDISPADELSYMACRDATIVAGLSWMRGGKYPVVFVKDLNAQRALQKRVREAADRQRELEEKRRQTFKP